MDEIAEIRRRRAENWRSAREDPSAVAGESGSPTASTVAGERRSNDAADARSESQDRMNTSLGATATRHVGVAQGEQVQQQEEPRCCRICFGNEESGESGRLFSPCRCTGSMQLVHVCCLDTWRTASQNEASYYRCDSCHYEYRLERLRLAQLIMSQGFQRMLTALVFLLSAGTLGLLCHWLSLGLLPVSMELLQIPPAFRVFFMTDAGKGNPACWQNGFTYEACCLEAEGGNAQCWDEQHSFETCCKVPSEALLHFRVAMAPMLQVFGSGGIVLSVIGFAMYLLRELKNIRGDANGQWHLMWMAAAAATYNGQAASRLVAFVGTAVALRELCEVLSVRMKVISGQVGVRVLEVA